MAAVDTGGIPVRALRPWAQEHHEQAQRVRAVALDVVVRRLHIAVRFGHLRAAEHDDALVLQRQSWFIEPQLTEVAERLADEAHVQQMQDGVLDPAGVLRDRQPLLPDGLVHERRLVLRVEVAVHVPRRVDERVHRVGLPPRELPAFRTGRLHEGLDLRQRVPALGVERGISRQHDRQLVVWHGHRAIGVAVHDGYGRAPVALA